jgi:hypothetical protein
MLRRVAIVLYARLMKREDTRRKTHTATSAAMTPRTVRPVCGFPSSGFLS